MTKKPKPTISLIYTILANDQPLAAIKASGTEAREICREPWFKEELASLKSNGEPVLKPGVKLRVRPAVEDELLRYDKEFNEAQTPEDILFVYLIKLDP